MNEETLALFNRLAHPDTIPLAERAADLKSACPRMLIISADRLSTFSELCAPEAWLFLFDHHITQETVDKQSTKFPIYLDIKNITQQMVGMPFPTSFFLLEIATSYLPMLEEWFHFHNKANYADRLGTYRQQLEATMKERRAAEQRGDHKREQDLLEELSRLAGEASEMLDRVSQMLGGPSIEDYLNGLDSRVAGSGEQRLREPGDNDADRSEWPNQKLAASLLNVSPGQVSKWVADGTLKTNGKGGKACRVNPTSIAKFRRDRDLKERAGDNSWANGGG